MTLQFDYDWESFTCKKCHRSFQEMWIALHDDKGNILLECPCGEYYFLGLYSGDLASFLVKQGILKVYCERKMQENNPFIS